MSFVSPLTYKHAKHLYHIARDKARAVKDRPMEYKREGYIKEALYWRAWIHSHKVRDQA